MFGVQNVITHVLDKTRCGLPTGPIQFENKCLFGGILRCEKCSALCALICQASPYWNAPHAFTYGMSLCTSMAAGDSKTWQSPRNATRSTSWKSNGHQRHHLTWSLRIDLIKPIWTHNSWHYLTNNTINPSPFTIFGPRRKRKCQHWPQHASYQNASSPLHFWNPHSSHPWPELPGKLPCLWQGW